MCTSVLRSGAVLQPIFRCESCAARLGPEDGLCLPCVIKCHTGEEPRRLCCVHGVIRCPSLGLGVELGDMTSPVCMHVVGRWVAWCCGTMEHLSVGVAAILSLYPV